MIQWYWMILIIYTVWVLVQVVSVGKRERFDASDYVVGFIAIFITSPYFALLPWFFASRIMEDTKKIRYRSGTELSTDAKKTLVQLGFKEGDYIAPSGQDYRGFRRNFYSGREITVTNAGQMTMWGKPTKEMKVLFRELGSVIVDPIKSTGEAVENYKRWTKEAQQRHKEAIAKAEAEGVEK